MFLWYSNAQDEIWVQRKCTHNSVITKACMLGNQSDVLNLKKGKNKLKTNFYTINAVLIKLCFVRIVNVFYWLHIIYTCSLVTIRFSIASSILTLVHMIFRKRYCRGNDVNDLFNVISF